MSELIINKARACAVSGHRIIENGFDVDNLKEVFVKLIGEGFNIFLVGMALGFDTLCFNVIYDLKSQYDIKLIACIPCKNQDLKFTKSQKKEYDKILSLADEKIILSDEYSANCMQKRNEFLIDNASILVAYLRHDFGGTFNTVNYARKCEIPIISL